MSIDTIHAVYCDSTCTPSDQGQCETKASWGDTQDTDDSGWFDITTTYAPDAAVYVHVEGDVNDLEQLDALIAHLTEARIRMAKQYDNS